MPRFRPTGAAFGRRRFLGVGAAAVVWVATGCSDTDDSTPARSRRGPGTTTAPTVNGTSADGRLVPGDFDALGTCVLLPEMTAGPFPNLEQLDRRDITEGYPGRPLRLGLRVVDRACTPVPAAAVEVWHTDASGDYSSYSDGGTGKDEAGSTTFLRGIQTADPNGIVEFATIYPGWYGGRAVHIHVRVHRGGALVLTSQLFFADDLTADVFATGPYAEFGPPDTTNAADTIAGDVAENGSLLHVTESTTGTAPELLALLNLGVSA